MNNITNANSQIKSVLPNRGDCAKTVFLIKANVAKYKPYISLVAFLAIPEFPFMGDVYCPCGYSPDVSLRILQTLKNCHFGKHSNSPFETAFPKYRFCIGLLVSNWHNWDSPKIIRLSIAFLNAALWFTPE